MEEQNQNIFIKWRDIIYSYIFPQQINRRKAITAFSVAFVLALVLSSLFNAPRNFPVGSVVEITPGQSLQSITVDLHNRHVIGSEFVFRSLVILFGGERKVIAGNYLLEKKQGAFFLARRFVNGQFGIDVAKITIPEGWNVFQMGDYLEKNLIGFDKAKFLSLAKSKEGYLFPDTYFVSEAISPEEVIEMMQNNFEDKIASIPSIATSKHTLKEIIIMASILEGEAKPKDRNMVAGILWRRLEIGMPLQVDSTFSYINGKNSYDLTLSDLEIDSPYNTYEYKGLPPGPISNPGLEAILSAANPIKTKYLYFLTEKNGTIHYAKTFDEHKENKETYLR